MLVFGHMVSAALPARWATPKADLRAVIFFALLADLIDKPLGLIIFRQTLNNGRVYFHSLFVNLLITGALVAWRKPLIYALALWSHQLCDLMWTRPWIALWPFTGALGYRNLPLEDWVYSVLNPYNVTTEAVGLAITVFFVARYRLWDRRRLRGWLRTGKLERI
jgi:inner membrane protein